MSNPPVRFLHLLLLVVLLSFLGAQMLHEAGHWTVLQLTGREPVWGFTSLVQLWDREPADPAQWVEIIDPRGDRGWLRLSSLPSSRAEWVAFLAAGSLFQLGAVVAGILVMIFAKRDIVRELGLLVALINSFAQFTYQVVAPIRGSGGDEYLLSYHLGVPMAAVSVPLALAFAAGLIWAFYQLDGSRMRLKYAAVLMLGIIPQGPLLMRANEIVRDQVDAGNPLFQPVFGFSLPVLILSLLAFLALVAIVRSKANRAIFPARDYN